MTHSALERNEFQQREFQEINLPKAIKVASPMTDVELRKESFRIGGNYVLRSSYL